MRPGRIFIGLGILLLGVGLFSALATQTLAQTDETDVIEEASRTGLLINCDQAVPNEDGTITLVHKCTIEDFINQFVILAQWGQSVVILLGVLFMIWGGVQWITAGGRPSKVEDGKRIVQGTIIGIIISYTAYIIINFSVGAITGTQTSVFNPFSGPISTVFGGKAGLEKPFGGVDGVNNITECRAQWDNSCSDQIYCADPGTSTGRISSLQEALNSKGCGCGDVDGCFGNQTATCVRNFQIANDLEPTGVVDDETESLALGLVGVSCSNDAVRARIDAVNDALPAFSVSRATGQPRTEVGCCVVKKRVEGELKAVMCSDLMSRRNCQALGAENTFISGTTRCSQIPAARPDCGFCHNPSNKHCFEMVGQYWCTDVVEPPISFSDGPCQGSALCQTPGGTYCQESLYTSPSF